MISDSLSNINNNDRQHIYYKNMNLARNGSNSNGKGTAQACAACKYQRKKCVPDCILAPYFPHDRQRQFLNAHKLFGVSNITKIIKNLSQIEKDEAMRTIVFQSDVRAADPVGGCYRIIRDLQNQIEYSRAEIDLVLQQLAVFRAQARQHNQAYVTTQPTHDVNVNATAPMNGDHVMIHADPLSLCNNSGTGVHDYHYLHQQPDEYAMVQQSNSSGSNCNTTHMEDPNSLGVHNTTSTLSTLSLQGNNAEYDNGTLLAGMTTNHFRFNIPEEFERSDDVVLFKVDDDVLIKAEEEDPSPQVKEYDLKDAASLFTLTNFNT